MFRNTIRRWRSTDPPANIGPAGNMIELIVIVADEDRNIVIHAMPARPNFLALLDQPGGKP